MTGKLTGKVTRRGKIIVIKTCLLKKIILYLFCEVFPLRFLDFNVLEATFFFLLSKLKSSENCQNFKQSGCNKLMVYYKCFKMSKYFESKPFALYEHI